MECCPSLYRKPRSVSYLHDKRVLSEDQAERVRALLRDRVTTRPTRGAFGSPKRILFLWLVLIGMFIIIYQTLGPASKKTRVRHQDAAPNQEQQSELRLYSQG